MILAGQDLTLDFEARVRPAPQGSDHALGIGDVIPLTGVGLYFRSSLDRELREEALIAGSVFVGADREKGPRGELVVRSRVLRLVRDPSVREYRLSRRA